jgi:hypothetical protein
MDKLYVSLKPFKDNTKNGLPVDIYMIYTEKINVSKPMEPYYSNDWLFYYPKRHGFPVPDKYKLPENLYLICREIGNIKFDFYTQALGQWIVSDDFFEFINENNLFNSLYEVAELQIQTTKGMKLGLKKYYLMRFVQYNDDLVDWENSPQITANRRTGIKFNFYNGFIFNKDKNIPEAMYFSKIAFKQSFIITEKIKTLMEKKQFSGFDLYTLNDFVEESQKRIEYFNIKK